jgi:hypothetical protein
LSAYKEAVAALAFQTTLDTSTSLPFGLLFVIQLTEYIELKSKVAQFMSVGPRFTAANGQEVCMRVQELEKAAGITVKPCSYYITPGTEK